MPNGGLHQEETETEIGMSTRTVRTFLSGTSTHVEASVEVFLLEPLPREDATGREAD
jgi:hypothetical protein